MLISGQLSPCLEKDFSPRKSKMKESTKTKLKICLLQSVCYQSAINDNAINNIFSRKARCNYQYIPSTHFLSQSLFSLYRNYLLCVYLF